ncbi:MAG TPA: GGDEF domain-containing protein [Thermoleophilaceae bacterium]|jgi:diguanylate cyclase (GGDEF)-like protein
MWVTTGVGGLLMLLLPGNHGVHLRVGLALGGFAIAWGLFSLYLWQTKKTMSVQLRAVVTAAMMPVVALALWATGGAASFLQPALLFTALFVSYFFPPRLAWPLIGLFVFTFATPLFYDGSAMEQGYAARTACFALAVAGEALVMRFLKHRLLRAEAYQRAMAERDPLTNVANRRAFDAALETAIPGQAALILFDFNDFKTVNDVHGHPVGDAVLRAVARASESVVREGDCLARIGGDEFALLAPGARAVGVARMVDSLDEIIREADVPNGVDPIRATFGWAVAPEDAMDGAELFRLADLHLIERKRAIKSLESGLQAS